MEYLHLSVFQKKLTDDKNMKNMSAQSLASLIFAMFGVDKEQKINQQQFIDGYLGIFVFFFYQ
jgi:hypothetical protein